MNNIFKFSLYIFLTLAFAWLAFVVGAKNQYGDLTQTSESLEKNGSIIKDAELYPQSMAGIAQLGAKDYLSLGCVTCHTQQVRSEESGFDVERGWGKRPSVPRDYILQDEVLLGHNRVGPDLANVGLREYSGEWLHKHLFMPQTVVDGSICQPSPFLYKISKSPTESSIKTETIDKSEIHIIPSLRANRIVSYLQSLHQNYQLPEIAFSDLDEEDETILSEVAASVSISETNSSSLPSWLNQQITSGKEIYSKLSAGGGMCVACHLPNGQGQTGAFPPLAGSDWVLGDKERLIKISIHGLQGEIVVNGEKYVGAMQGFGQPLSSPLDDQQIADVLTYIRNEWGNSVSAISPEEVKAVRDSEKNRELVSMWTNAELQKEDSSD
jgi:cytochrome c oxidase cbb3-type subunit 2